MLALVSGPLGTLGELSRRAISICQVPGLDRLNATNQATGVQLVGMPISRRLVLAVFCFLIVCVFIPFKYRGSQSLACLFTPPGTALHLKLPAWPRTDLSSSPLLTKTSIGTLLEMMRAWVLLVTLATSAFASNCYYPDGNKADDYDYQPCGSSITTFSTCCYFGEGDVCLENGLCKVPNKYDYYRAACANKDWSGCPEVCMDGKLWPHVQVVIPADALKRNPRQLARGREVR